MQKIFLLTHLVLANENVGNIQPRYNESCDALENAERCENDCIENLVRCVDSCGPQSCLNECRRNAFMCSEPCPCHAECPLGCQDCPSWACVDNCEHASTNEQALIVNFIQL